MLFSLLHMEVIYYFPAINYCLYIYLPPTVAAVPPSPPTHPSPAAHPPPQVTAPPPYKLSAWTEGGLEPETLRSRVE